MPGSLCRGWQDRAGFALEQLVLSQMRRPWDPQHGTLLWQLVGLCTHPQAVRLGSSKHF